MPQQAEKCTWYLTCFEKHSLEPQVALLDDGEVVMYQPSWKKPMLNSNLFAKSRKYLHTQTLFDQPNVPPGLNWPAKGTLFSSWSKELWLKAPIQLTCFKSSTRYQEGTFVTEALWNSKSARAICLSRNQAFQIITALNIKVPVQSLCLLALLTTNSTQSPWETPWSLQRLLHRVLRRWNDLLDMRFEDGCQPLFGFLTRCRACRWRFQIQ